MRNGKTMTAARLAIALAMTACPGVGGSRTGFAETIVVEVDASGGRPFHRGVFGQNVHASSYLSEGYGKAHANHQRIIERTSLRGVAGGMYADVYDWKRREGAHGPLRLPDGRTARGESTLELLRTARDHGSDPVLTVNQRGLGTIDDKGAVVYSNTSTAMLAAMAADWTRYVNRIVPTYRQGDAITDPEDRRVLNEIDWSGPDFRSDKLLAPGEAPVPKVTYWEIGNEVNFFDDPETHRARYHEITAAMLAVDPTIKVGPNVTGGLQSGAAEAARFLERLLQPGKDADGPAERVDFISHHPYGHQILNVKDDDHAAISRRLNEIRDNLLVERNWVRDWIARSGRDPDSMELLATEWNPSTYDNAWRMRQWNGQGVVETAMGFAEMGYSSAHFWVWPSYIHTGALPAQYLAFEALTQHGGDVLVASRAEEDFRLRVTRDSRTGVVAVWAMNFRFGDPDDAAITVRLSLRQLGFEPGAIALRRLGSKTGRTTLLTTTPTDPATPAIGWIAADLAGADPANLVFDALPAELTLLLVQPRR